MTKRFGRMGLALAIFSVLTGVWLLYSTARAPVAWAVPCTDEAPYGMELLVDSEGVCYTGWGGGE